MKSKKQSKRLHVRKGIRRKISGTAERPRLAVFKSNNGIYVQIIDDVNGRTILQCSSHQVSESGKKNCVVAEKIGKKIGENALKKDIKHIVFDRGGWPYHGKIASVATGARTAGLVF